MLSKHSDEIEPFLDYKSWVYHEINVRIQTIKSLSKDSFEHFGHPKLLGSLRKLRLHFLAFDHVRLHFLCSKSSIFLTTYPPLNANVICEGSLMKLLYLGHGQSYCRLFLFLLSFCDLLLWEFCNILKRFYSGFFTSNFLILATNNDGIQHDRQPTHSNYFWSFFFHNDFSKKSGERWTSFSFEFFLVWLVVTFFISGPEGHK